jgi:hypothetical protein
MSISITAPHLGTLITTGMSYSVMNGMLSCVKISKDHLAREAVKYVALGFGALTMLEFKDNASHIRTDERDKIDLLCSKGHPDNLNYYQ